MKALDTDVVIHFFSSTSTRASSGVAQSTQRAQLGSLAAAVSILPFDEPAARSAAEIRSVLARTGNMIGPLDILIAGTALAHDAVLVTHNTREFERVPGLKIVDWH